MRTSSHQRRDSGFSFIELLAYMTIAALLILAAIPQFDHHRQKASLSNLENDAHNASLAAESLRTGGQDDAADVDVIQAAVDGVDRADGTSFRVTPVGADDYRIVATNEKVDPYSVVYASSTSKSGGTTMTPGLHIVRDGKVLDCPSCNVDDQTSLAPEDGWGVWGISLMDIGRFRVSFNGTAEAFSDFSEVTGIRLADNASGTVAPEATIDGRSISTTERPATWTLTAATPSEGPKQYTLSIFINDPAADGWIMGSSSVAFVNATESGTPGRPYTFNMPR